ncbi:hypothetical protein [Glycomyces dulcitolivorans]|uniref:hypothetical protein n=1 Tax=Glycomyces dulcitolivorans TaxID=2200759 RepID=UPI000DD4AD72|nr:hypothetical protein [Glycomyces dulcitolivorans]
MTRSGERSALDPDPVPVHHRLRELLARHPEGPLPKAEIVAIRKSLSPPPQVRSAQPPSDFESRKQARRAASARLAAIINGTNLNAPSGLRDLGDRLRAAPGDCGRRFLFPDDLHLSHSAASAIASHLLRTGTTGIELTVGLNLASDAGAEVDAVILREVALLGRSYAFGAVAALSRAAGAAQDLYWVLRRIPDPERQMIASEFGSLPQEAVGELLETLATAEAVSMVLALADLRPVPELLRDNARIRELLTAVSADPGLLAPGPSGRVGLVRLWDEVRYGGCALLGFAPGERAAVAGGFCAALADPGVLAEVERALEKRPADSELIWLRQQVEEARTGRPAFSPGLALQVWVPPPSTHREPELHVVVDGEPLATSWFGRGHPHPPENVLDRGPGLRGAAEPIDIRLSEADCVEECCGAFRAHIYRDESAGTVVWEVRDTERPSQTRRFSFDSEDYDAELDRAIADRTWTWPARRAARLLRERLQAEPELLGRWKCRRGWINSSNRDRGVLEFTFTYPEEDLKPERPWLQFKRLIEIPDAFEVDDRAVAATVNGFIAMLRTTDPKTVSTVVGGSRKSAEELGFPWPG